MPEAPDNLDPILVRGLTQPRLSRRGFLQAGTLGAALSVAACAAPGQKKKAQSSSQSSSFWANQKMHHKLNFANQSHYIDQGADSTLNQFARKYGIQVNYKEIIESDESWFAKVQPELSAGQATGWDLAILGGDHFMSDMIKLGYLTELDHARIPNFANVSNNFKNGPWDPGNRFSMPWQSGMAGIMYNPDKIKKPITSWNDLQNPALKGKVSMMDDVMELPIAALLAVGADPTKSTPTDWKKAAAWLKKQRGAGIVREYTQTTYTTDMLNGNLWACQAYSGDAYQLRLSGAKFEFVIPDEGAPQWVDNMVIPAKAANPVDAIMWMNWIYQPEMAAKLEEALNYFCPVPAAQHLVAQQAAKATGKTKQRLSELSKSALSFPTAKDLAKAHPFPVFETSAKFKQWSDIFTPIYQS
jgi:spermidine/putrescine transport system substrate-binding protein